MFSNFNKHFFVLLIISLVSLVGTFVAKDKIASKKSLVVKYQLDNYYLTSEQSLYPVIAIIVKEIENAQYSIRDKIYTDPNCNFLNPKYNTFSIIKKQRDQIQIEIFTNNKVNIFTNDKINKESLFNCFYTFEENLNNFKNDMIKRIFTRRQLALKNELTNYENILERLDAYGMGMPILLKIGTINNQIISIDKFLELNLQKSIIIGAQKKYNENLLNLNLVFASIFFTILAVYIIFIFSKQSKKKVYNKVYNKVLKKILS